MNRTSLFAPTTLRRIGLGLALGAVTLAPFAATTAQAQPVRPEFRSERNEVRPDQRELFADRRNDRDYRNDRRDNDRDNRWDNDHRGPGHPANNWNRPDVTYYGTVVRDLPGNQFSLRTRSGTFRVVVTGERESRRLSQGDTVRITGKLNGGTFVARDVDIVRNR